MQLYEGDTIRGNLEVVTDREFPSFAPNTSSPSNKRTCNVVSKYLNARLSY